MGAMCLGVVFVRVVYRNVSRWNMACPESNRAKELEEGKKGKRKRQYISPTESVNCKEGWDSENELDDTNTH